MTQCGEEVEGEEFFVPDDTAVSIYRSFAARILALPGVQVRATKSQVAFRARRAFAYAWAPSRYVTSDVSVVLSIALPERLPSERFKQVAHPSPSVWMHHLELRRVEDVDPEVVGWILQAYDRAS